MNKKSSGAFFAPEDVGSEVAARNLLPANGLDGGPVLRVEQGLVVQPVGNGLLANGREIRREASDALSELGLVPTRDLDNTPQRTDVRRVRRLGRRGLSARVAFLHEWRGYKRAGDSVKCAGDLDDQQACVTENKDPCKVLYMPNAQRKDRALKPAKPKRQKKPFPVGPDGKTANARLSEALKSHPIFEGSEAALVRACNRIAGRADDEKDYVSQQQVNNFLNDIDSLGRSRYVAVLAEALGVRALWLQDGIGPRRIDEEMVLRDYMQWRREHSANGTPR